MKDGAVLVDILGGEIARRLQVDVYADEETPGLEPGDLYWRSQVRYRSLYVWTSEDGLELGTHHHKPNRYLDLLVGRMYARNDFVTVELPVGDSPDEYLRVVECIRPQDRTFGLRLADRGVILLGPVDGHGVIEAAAALTRLTRYRLSLLKTED